MRVFLDTSAFLAIIDADDDNHAAAKKKWRELILAEAEFFCNNYVLIETFALLQHRFGMTAVNRFSNDVVSFLHIHWIDEAIHQAATSALLAAARKKLSLVDCVSFETMRSLGIKTAFSFDKHFTQQGFNRIPQRRK
ncbi:MAG: PIN domain-containing protein [Deltaproteobacteria bacterium]|nr:PIN domain-containing protein [Deltaproteobacteria bacterium]